MQRGISRRDKEDAEHPKEKWGTDRAESDFEDLDPSEEEVPIANPNQAPRPIPGSVPGKASL